MLRRVRGFLQLHRYRFGVRWAYFAAIVGLLMGLVVLLLAPPAGPLGLAIAALLTSLATATFIRDTNDIVRAIRGTYIVNIVPDLESLEMPDNYSTYERLSFRGGLAVFSREVNHRLANSRTPFVVVDGKYSLPPEYARVAIPILNRRFQTGAALFNGRKIRLQTDLSIEALNRSSPISLQETTYFSGLTTNEFALAEVRHRDQSEPLLRGSAGLRNNGYLVELSSSPFSNHIGIGTLAITRDLHLITTTQSSRSAQSPELMASSGSGSADFTDIALSGADDLQTLVVFAMERELREECGISLGVSIDTRLIGHARLLHRGGKPEFFGLSFVDCDSADLAIPRGERLFLSALRDHKVSLRDTGAFAAAIARIREEERGSLGFDLFVELVLLEDYLATLTKRGTSLETSLW